MAEDFTATHRVARQESCATAAETQQLAGVLAARYAKGGLLYLIGPLGAGKTTFVQGLLGALGYSGHPKSPSFVLQHLYECPNLTVEHWDWYRLADSADDAILSQARELGVSGALVLVEWPEPLIARGFHDDAELLVIVPSTGEAERPTRTITLWTPRTGED